MTTQRHVGFNASSSLFVVLPCLLRRSILVIYVIVDIVIVGLDIDIIGSFNVSFVIVVIIFFLVVAIVVVVVVVVVIVCLRCHRCPVIMRAT